MHGTEQTVKINSEPAGMNATIDNGTVITTPAEIVLKRNRSYTVEFENPGGDNYRVKINNSLSGWFFGNFIFLGGWWIGMIVDAANGAMWTLEPEVINVSFDQKIISHKQSGKGKYNPQMINIPEYTGKKVTVAVLSIQKGVGLSEELTGFIVEHIKSTMVQSGVFIVAEKENVDKMLITNVSKLGDKFFVNLQLTDTNSNVIESTGEEHCYCELDELPVAAEVAARKLIVNFLNKPR